jgi:NAD+ synthase (glutamine-hydrolysing)
MPTLRLALVQANPTVGDLVGNVAKVMDAVAAATERGAQLVALPEMFVTGYPVEDLALRPSFQEASRAAVDRLARLLDEGGHGDIPVVVGYLDRLEDEDDRLGSPRGAPINAAAVLQHGRVVARYVKHHLPNYGVFDEFRYFVPGDEPCVLRVAGVDVALAICEDLWQEGGTVELARGSGLLLVLNGSPYERNKDDVRLDLCQRRAAETGAVVAYVNMVGGQDELVFDGDSVIVRPDGNVVARAAQFVDEILIADLDLPGGSRSDAVDLGDPAPRSRRAISERIAPRAEDAEEVYGALVVGLRDYVDKNGFASVVLGLSGGIDSALVAAIACDALGADRVYGVSLPSAYSSDHSLADAADLAQRTGLHHRTVPIIPMVDAFEASLHLTGLAAENLQARVRGVTLMALSNAEGHLVLATGNKSEISVGYSTIYGDAVGGFAPIKDVPKTLVWELSRWRNARAESAGQTPPIPANSITKPPSAELRPGQLDQDSLPDYALLDDILDDYVEHDRGMADLVAQGFDAETVERIIHLTDAAEYKRRQYPPGTKISLRAFGRDRRQPITNHWRELDRQAGRLRRPDGDP